MAFAAVAVTAHARGQVLAFFAIVLPIAVVPVAVYSVDATAAGLASASLQSTAAEAAEAAAQRIDVTNLRATGSLRLDDKAAEAAAVAIVHDEARGAAIQALTVSGDAVTVELTEAYVPPIAWSPRPLTLHAHAAARIVAGYESPSSRLPLPTSNF